ncbi:MAG: OmpA family protein [Desulfobacteraceae bacterium]|nr:OmpA family protein [Desulfobacteraceae bacterium]
MAERYLRMLFFVMVSVALVANSAIAQDLNSKIESGQYVQKADNFIVILDASGSKNDPVHGQKKLSLVKDIISHMNKAIPDIKLQSAMRRYGKGIKQSSKIKTELVYGPADYSREEFGQSLDTVKKASGLTFMEAAIDAASNDTDSFEKEKTSVVIISDGKIHIGDPVQAAERMKARHGDNICIFTIFVPSDTADINQVARDRKLMKDIAGASHCGFSESADNIDSEEGMTDFVEKVFLASVNDTDGDGVPNDKDQCPDTPLSVEVDENGCPIQVKPEEPEAEPEKIQVDTDGDGVFDDKDVCPNTPKGAVVSQNGCWIVKNLLFDFNKWDIKSEFYKNLDQVVSILEKNPGLNITIKGHTDNIGTKEYNMKLSEKRAKAVMEYFLKKGINKDRLASEGYGFTKPVGTNSTSEGRAKNRRVELHH